MRLAVLSLVVGCSYTPPNAATDSSPGDGAETDAAPVDAPTDAWLTGWSHRKSITIDHTKVTAPDLGLRDFPVAILLPADPEIAAVARSDGADLVVTGADATTKLPIELERYASGEIALWVQVEALKADADTRLYLYYGNNSPPSVTPELVWTNQFLAVWHLNQTPAAGNAGDIKDATANNHDGEPDDSMSDNDLFQNGFVGPAIRFDGGNEFIDIPSTITLGDQFTISAWVFHQGGTNGIKTVFSNSLSGLNVSGCRLFVNSDNSQDRRIIFETSNGTANASASTNANQMPVQIWTHVAVQVDRAAGAAKIYVDGVDRTISGTVRNDFANTTSSSEIARMGDLFTWIGRLDEIELASELRSEAWIKTAFSNQGKPAEFFDVGVQELDPN